MENNRKYFLDLSGLSHLWKKMLSTFADKFTTETNFETIYAKITNIFNKVDKLDLNVLGISPKIVDTYSLALETAKTLLSGAIIKVNNSEIISDKMYISGFYIVESVDPVSLKLIGISSGIHGDSVVEKLDNRLSKIESSAITSVNYDDNKNYKVVDNQLIIRYDDTFIVNSDSLNALTHKAIATKFGQLENLITNLPKFTIKIVEELPKFDISTSTIYLVRTTSSDNKNLYTEYVYVELSYGVWSWEKLGEHMIGLSDYVTKQEVEDLINSAVSKFASKKYVDDAIELAKSDVILNVVNDFVAKNDLDEMVLTSINFGDIGDGMAIPYEDVEKLKFL